MNRSLILLLIIILFSFQCAFAQSSKNESIIDYNSDIRIQTDASIVVDERITVNAQNLLIKHGIYRDFPTKYKDNYGNTVNIGFTIIDVLKNGDSEPYFTQNKSNGIRIYIGKKDQIISPGTYTYQITYRVTRELGFFKKYDELYWNVTGNGWVFPIEHVSATVHLLPGSEVLQYAAYTGPMGAQGQDFSVQKESSAIRFNTTRTLNAYEGLTIAVAWPKGFVPEPTEGDKLKYLAYDNLDAVVSVLGTVVILIYFIIVWFRFGRDPRKGTIIPRFEVPDGLSPASIAYITNMGWMTKLYRAFTAALINIAVKNKIRIYEKRKKYTIEKGSDNTESLAPEEALIVNRLLSFNSRFEFDTKNHKAISNILTNFKETIANVYRDRYFILNTGYFIGGIMLTFLLIAGIALSSHEPPLTGFMLVWLTFWTFGLYILLVQVIKSWKAFFGGSILAFFGAIFITIFALPFIFGEMFGIGLLIQSTSYISFGCLTVVLLINCLFYNLLKQRTPEGRQLMDKIEGFKMFLSTTEEERFKELYPPDITPEVFEKYLPYAVALNIENEWSKKCERAIGKSQFEAYQPTWYVGTYSMLGAAAIAQSLGSTMSGAISSSSSAPGSSSGSGGGGSSGGGGGGGGGGGW